MSDLRSFRSGGVIPQPSGAAVAALKARAAAWEVPLIESPDRLSLLVWDCELRLMPLPDSLRIDLSGPEQRLVGNLRESATELFAEVDRAADREREQPALFDAQRTAAAVAGAQPLRADGPTGGRGDSTGADHADEESTAEDSVLTVSQAARQAEIIAELRDRLAAGAAQQVRARLAVGEGDDPDTGYQRSDDVSLSDTEQVDHDSGLST